MDFCPAHLPFFFSLKLLRSPSINLKLIGGSPIDLKLIGDPPINLKLIGGGGIVPGTSCTGPPINLKLICLKPIQGSPISVL